MKKIELLFYKVNPSAKNTGLKHVLFEVTTDEAEVKHDWGFAYWDGSAWEEIEMPEGFEAKVHSWANTVDPELLLKDKSLIIT